MKAQISAIDAVQRRAERYIMVDYVDGKATVWGTFIKAQISAVDAVQRRAARYIMVDYVDGKAASPLSYTSFKLTAYRPAECVEKRP